ncbi:MAG: AAA family ATPase [Moorella sp. (in: firmicutes)]
MPAVTWRRLSLWGFGCYRDGVKVTFQDGLNVLVAPNERGKSTLVAGLEAVLFGLPNTANPEAFGTTRFANREGAERFEGELEFLVDGVPYVIKRHFATNRVTLRRREENGWEEIWRGTHNPGAHKKIPIYIDHLTNLLGITSRELFEATFCLGQPLPEGRALDNEVQKLLSGSGGHYQEALQHLAGSLRSLTRYCGDMGVGNNGRKDARLEELRTEIAALQRVKQASGDTMEELTAVRARLQELAAELKNAREELKKRRELRDAWDRWRALHVRYQGFLREQRQAGTALARARELEQKIRASREEASRLYPEWESFIEGSEGLDRLLELEGEITRLQKEADAGEAQVNELRVRREDLTARLKGELAAVADHPDILRDLEELERLRREIAELAAKMEELAAREAETAAALAALPDFATLGTSPAAVIEGLQTAARGLIADWERFEKDYTRCRELKKELAGELSCFAALSPEQEELAANYEYRRAALEKEEREAGENCRRLEERKEAYRKREEEYHRRFRDLDALGEDALHALAEKPKTGAELKLKEAVLQSSLAAGRRRRAVLAILVGAGLLTGAVVGIMGGSWPAAAVIILLCCLGGAAWIYLGRPRDDAVALEAEVAALKERLRGLDAVLGPWADAPLEKLDELRHRLLERERARAELAALAASLPGVEEEEERAQQALTAAVKARQEFTAATAAFAVRFTDVAAAFQRYRNARDELKILEIRLKEFSEKNPGVAVEEAFKASPRTLDAPWPGLAALARLYGRSSTTTGELLEWLKELEKGGWEEILERARQWEELAAKKSWLNERREQLLQPDDKGQTTLTRLEAAVAALEVHVAPFTKDDKDAVASLLTEAETVKKELAAMEGSSRAVTARVEELKSQIAKRKSEADELRRALAPVLAATGGDAGKALERRRSYEQMVRERQGWQEQLTGLLGGGSLEELEAAGLDAANRTLIVLQEWRALAQEHPGLPEPGEEIKGEELEARYKKLQEETSALENQVQGLEEEERGLLRRQSQLEGGQIANVAVTAEILAARERELARLEMEAAALALAYRELEEAARDYSREYRRELAAAATRYFILFTGKEERRVELTEDFRVEVKETGAAIPLAQLSRGAQDQLYLALRLAIGDLLSAALTLPFIFDDCFVNCDAERRRRIRESLTVLAEKRQLLLLTHDPDFAGWGSLLQVEEGN